MKKKTKMGVRASSISVSTTEALLVHLTIGLGLALCFSVAHNVHFISLTSHPSQALGLIWVPIFSHTLISLFQFLNFV